jgi:hypothetical protein
MQHKHYFSQSVLFSLLAVAGAASIAVVCPQLVAADQTGGQEGRTGEIPQRIAPLESARKDGDAHSLQNARNMETGSQPKQKEMRRGFRLQTEGQADELMKALPKMSRATDLQIQDVRLKSIPDGLLTQMGNCASSTKSLIIGGGNLPAGKTAPEISDLGMEQISQLRTLKSLCLSCRFSGTGFAHLSKLRELETLGLDYPTINAKEFFETVSKLPKIRTIGVHYADFSQPINAATYKAIALLNGRLESLSLSDEWHEGATAMHASMVPAIAEIESLTWLELGSITYQGADRRRDAYPWATCGLDAYIARKLPYLENFEPSSIVTKPGTEAPPRMLTLKDYQRREYSPVQFRNVDSPAAMLVLLRHVLGLTEANKVRGEVVRRRAGLAHKEDFTQSGLGLATILRESFGVTVYPNARSTLNQIPHAYPELNKTIRRYLSGKDLEKKGDSPIIDRMGREKRS